MSVNRAFSTVLLLLSFLPGSIQLANAQSSPSTKDSMLGEWVVTIKASDSRKLVLNVKAEERKDDTLSLDATFGRLDGSDKRQLPEATLATEDTETKLAFRTQSGYRYIALRNSSGAFDGAYTAPSGQSTPVVIERVSGRPDLQSAIDLDKELTPLPPDSAVPRGCAVFSGRWKGDWLEPNGGSSTLIVRSIDSACVAKVLINQVTSQAKIGDGKIEHVPCWPTGGGVCKFTYSGSDDTLKVEYSRPGRYKEAIFSRLK